MQLFNGIKLIWLVTKIMFISVNLFIYGNPFHTYKTDDGHGSTIEKKQYITFKIK